MTKPVVRVHLLPETFSEAGKEREVVLKELHGMIVAAFIDLKLPDPDRVLSENDLWVLFPGDAMQYGLGKELYVEVAHLPREGCLYEDVADTVIKAVRAWAVQNLPNLTHVECRAEPRGQVGMCHWTRHEEPQP